MRGSVRKEAEAIEVGLQLKSYLFYYLLKRKKLLKTISNKM